MARHLNLFFLPISILFFAYSNTERVSAQANPVKGADIYCIMRSGGNDHNASWEAAYINVKNEKREGFFKTSPKQAASVIVEQVIQNREKYEECIPYLGDLYSPNTKTNEVNELTTEAEEINSSDEDMIDRYSY